jgi:hypothetical protein
MTCDEPLAIGDIMVWRLVIKVNGALRDLSLDVIYWALRKSQGSAVLFEKDSSGSDITILNQTTNKGEVDVVMTSAESETLKEGQYLWGSAADFDGFPDTGRKTLIEARGLPMVDGIVPPP